MTSCRPTCVRFWSLSWRFFVWNSPKFLPNKSLMLLFNYFIFYTCPKTQIWCLNRDLYHFNILASPWSLSNPKLGVWYSLIMKNYLIRIGLYYVKSNLKAFMQNVNWRKSDENGKWRKVLCRLLRPLADE